MTKKIECRIIDSVPFNSDESHSAVEKEFGEICNERFHFAYYRCLQNEFVHGQQNGSYRIDLLV